MERGKKTRNLKSKASDSKRNSKVAGGMPKSVSVEVRRLREEMTDLESQIQEVVANSPQDRGTDRTYSRTEHGVACSICGEIGSHVCLPILYQALEMCEELREATWKAFQQLEQSGYFREESEVSKELNLGIWD